MGRLSDAPAGSGGKEAAAGSQHTHQGQGEAVEAIQTVGEKEDQKKEQKGKKGGKQPVGKKGGQGRGLWVPLNGLVGEGLGAPDEDTAGCQA